MFDVKTAWVDSQPACEAFLRQHEADLILLDINLGDASGFVLCKQLRETTNAPILFISARGSTDDMLLALNIGGDDYIQKPYALSVLLAKVKAVLKRYRAQGAEADVFTAGDLQVDFASKTITVRGQRITLKSMEYKLLSYLIQHRGRPITKDELFTNVWGDAIAQDNTLNVHVRHLREKIEANPKEPLFIKTLWGVGYIFETGQA